MSDALIQEDYTTGCKMLSQLEQGMKTFQDEFRAIQVTLSWNNLATFEKAIETTYSSARKGAHMASPAVRTLLNWVAMPLATEGVATYKSQAAFQTLIHQACFRAYLGWEPLPLPQDNLESLETVL